MDSSVDIVLVAPPTKHITIAPHLGLGYLASISKKSGYSVNIIHSDKDRLRIKDIILKIKRINPKIICFSIVTMSYLAAKEIIKILKSERIYIPIVIGGPHISAFPEYSIKDLEADFAVIGEGEITFTLLLDYILKNRGVLKEIKGLSFRNNNSIYTNEPRELIKNLDELPFPAWDIIRPDGYPPLPHQIIFKKYPVSSIITTRGCCYNCYFCAVPSLWGKNIRTRSACNISAELELLINQYGIKEIHIEDDCFTFDRAHVINICKEIIKKKLDFIWSLPNGIRIDTITDELIAIMKQAGCYQVGLGIESSDNRTLERVNKNLNINTIKNAINIIKKNKLEIRAFYMIGFPEEKKEQIQNTLNFAKKLDTDFAVFGICAPIPGSKYFDDYFKEADYEKIEWGKITYYNGYYSKYLMPHTMKKLLRKCILSYFSSPQKLGVFLRRVKFNQIFFVIKGFLKYMFQ